MFFKDMTFYLLYVLFIIFFFLQQKNTINSAYGTNLPCCHPISQSAKKTASLQALTCPLSVTGKTRRGYLFKKTRRRPPRSIHPSEKRFLTPDESSLWILQFRITTPHLRFACIYDSVFFFVCQRFFNRNLQKTKFFIFLNFFHKRTKKG